MTSVVSDLDLLAEPFRLKAERLMEQIEREGLPFRVFETRRTMTRTQTLYMQGRAYQAGVLKKVGPTVSNARPGESPHNFGLAMDLVLVTDPEHTWWDGHAHELPKGPWDLGDSHRPIIKLAWDRLGRCARACDLVWGGDWTSFKDWPHVEIKQWQSFRPSDWKTIAAREVAAGR